MLLYKVASFVVIDFENGVDYISFSVFDFSALKNGTEYSFVNDQFQVNDYTDVTFIKDKSGTAYTEATLDAFIATIKVIDDPNTGNLPTGGTTGQILAKIDGTDYNAEWIDNLLDEVNPVCKLDENISKGQAVYISGADGTNKIIKKASNATELTSSKTFGLLSETGVTNNKIRVITLGYLSGLDTSSANEGDPVWLGVNGNLIYGYVNKPHAPEHLVFIGFVVRKNNVNGQIYVRVQNGFELDELHDVKIESPANKNTIFFNSSNSLWENRLIAIDDVSSLQSALNSKENTSNKGIANGYASLGVDGKVPSTQLPSYVDDVIEVANYAALPSVGETGVIYITLDNNKVYRWTGSTYVQISQPNAVWGSITGTLSNQTDLQSALNAKQDAATAINTSNIGSQSVAYATNAGNSDTLDGYHASAFQMVLTNPITGTGTTNYVSKFAGSGSIGDSLIFDNGFNVGIGTATPFRQLDVNGALRLQTGIIDFGNSVNNQIWVASNNINFKTNGSEKAIITSDGNFGIGTTNPNYTLDVNGFINATRIYPSSSNNTYITGDGNAGMAVVGSGYFYVTAVGGSYFQKEVRFRNIISNDTGAYLQINGGTTGVTYFAGTIGVGGSTVYHGSSIQVGNGIFYAQSNASDIGGKIYGYWDTGFQPYAGGLKFQVFRIETGSYQMYDAMTLSGSGNLGIGTTAPSQKLEITSNNRSLLKLYNTDFDYGANQSKIDFFGKWWSGDPNNENLHASIVGEHGTGDGFRRGLLRFYTNNDGTIINPMMINYNGNVGIGTTVPDPSAILHLESTTQGFLPPRMDNSEINSISNPAEGLIVYSTQSKCLFLFDGASWQKIAFA